MVTSTRLAYKLSASANIEKALNLGTIVCSFRILWTGSLSLISSKDCQKLFSPIQIIPVMLLISLLLASIHLFRNAAADALYNTLCQDAGAGTQYCYNNDIMIACGDGVANPFACAVGCLSTSGQSVCMNNPMPYPGGTGGFLFQTLCAGEDKPLPWTACMYDSPYYMLQCNADQTAQYFHCDGDCQDHCPDNSACLPLTCANAQLVP